MNFFAMTEHARTGARRNVAGPFAADVRQRRWQMLTLEDAPQGVFATRPRVGM